MLQGFERMQQNSDKLNELGSHAMVVAEALACSAQES